MMIYLIAAWLAVELTAQLARFGVTKAWRLGNLPGRRGITLHPLCIIYDDPDSLPHERIHARQMARYTWTGFLLLYVISGKWRVRLEAGAYAKANAPVEFGPRWIDGMVGKLLGPVYFPRFVRWQRPASKYAAGQLWRFLP